MPKRNHNENTNDEGSVCGDDTSSVSSQPQTRKRRKYASTPVSLKRSRADVRIIGSAISEFKFMNDIK